VAPLAFCTKTADISIRESKNISQAGLAERRKSIALVYSGEFPSYKEAYRRKQQVKRWSRTKKEALITGELVRLNKIKRRKRT